MSGTGRCYPKEEFERRGDAIYERDIKPKLNPTDHGKFVASDIETGEYEVDASRLEVCKRLDARLPGAQPWVVLVGSPFTFAVRSPRAAIA